MLSLESDWPMRRMIAAVIMLVMLVVVLAIHPSAPELINQPVAEITNIHELDSDEDIPVPNQVSHHDNSAEMFALQGFNLARAKAAVIFSCPQCDIDSVAIALNRPPQTVRC